ncbi:hypothetical protein [Mesorhizobium sp. LNHC209A00]|uniref:hypothetical protein n=1 Tax=Mesorhizobium TaxID=68287 RepID=UPI0012EB10B4|nr:hypothetical protein [Mesorhizobium sp. LNHC209A00]
MSKAHRLKPRGTVVRFANPWIQPFSEVQHMLNVISFTTKQPIISDEASFEILDWNDPVMRNYTREIGRVTVDGLVPLEIADKMKALCDEWNANRRVAG